MVNLTTLNDSIMHTDNDFVLNFEISYFSFKFTTNNNSNVLGNKNTVKVPQRPKNGTCQNPGLGVGGGGEGKDTLRYERDGYTPPGE